MTDACNSCLKVNPITLKVVPTPSSTTTNFNILNAQGSGFTSPNSSIAPNSSNNYYINNNYSTYCNNTGIITICQNGTYTFSFKGYFSSSIPNMPSLSLGFGSSVDNLILRLSFAANPCSIFMGQVSFNAGINQKLALWNLNPYPIEYNIVGFDIITYIL